MRSMCDKSRIVVLDEIMIPQGIPVSDQLSRLHAYMSDRYSELQVHQDVKP